MLMVIGASTFLLYSSVAEFTQSMMHRMFLMLINLLLAACILYAPTFFFRKHKIATTVYISICSVLILLGSFISSIKIGYRGTQFTLSDCVLFQEALSIAKGMDFSHLLPQFVVCVAICIIFMIVWHKFFWSKYAFSDRTMKYLSLSCALCGVAIIAIGQIFSQTQDSATLKSRGFLLGFITAQSGTVYVSQKDVEKALVHLDRTLPVSDSPLTPDVIYVLSEAFWDPLLLEDLTFSEDPIAYFRELQQSNTSGDALSSVFGGGTGDSEFELLTGYNKNFFGDPQSSAFWSVLQQPIASIVTTLEGNQYQTYGMHTYQSWFYERNKAYNYLGFNHFISMEFMSNIVQVGPWLEDMGFTEDLLDVIDRNPNEKLFIHALTMQNHGGYSPDRFPENTVKIEGNITQNQKDILETYCEGLKRSDQALRYLITELEKRNKPTLLVMVGDHLPFLDEDYALYKAANFITGDGSKQDYEKLHTVPLLIWDNFSETKDVLHTDMSMITPYVLERLGINGSVANRLASNLFDVKNTKLFPEEFREKMSNSEAIQEYCDIQQDILEGKNYTAKLLGIEPPSNPEYAMGYGDITITGTVPAELKTNNSYAVVELSGLNFPLKSPSNYYNFYRYSVNGTIMPVVTDSTHTNVSLYIPPELYAEPGDLLIQLLVYDSNDTIIAQSNTYSVPVAYDPFEIESQQQQGNTYLFKPKHPENINPSYTYTYYIYKDDELIDQLWYQPVPELTYTFKDAGQYRVEWFIHDRNSEAFSKSMSENITIATSN